MLSGQLTKRQGEESGTEKTGVDTSSWTGDTGAERDLSPHGSRRTGLKISEAFSEPIILKSHLIISSPRGFSPYLWIDSDVLGRERVNILQGIKELRSTYLLVHQGRPGLRM